MNKCFPLSSFFSMSAREGLDAVDWMVDWVDGGDRNIPLSSMDATSREDWVLIGRSTWKIRSILEFYFNRNLHFCLNFISKLFGHLYVTKFR